MAGSSEPAFLFKAQKGSHCSGRLSIYFCNSPELRVSMDMNKQWLRTVSKCKSELLQIPYS